MVFNSILIKRADLFVAHPFNCTQSLDGQSTETRLKVLVPWYKKKQQEREKNIWKKCETGKN